MASVIEGRKSIEKWNTRQRSEKRTAFEQDTTENHIERSKHKIDKDLTDLESIANKAIDD